MSSKDALKLKPKIPIDQYAKHNQQREKLEYRLTKLLEESIDKYKGTITFQKRLIKYRDFIDPCAFIDDDGKAYLFMGQHFVNVIELNDDMISYNGKIHIVEGANDFFEAVWVHKHNGKYYLSYSGKGQILYAMSDNILGPYEFKGTILQRVNSGTNHHSIVEYKGKWYLFYHTADLSRQKIPEDSKEWKFHKKRRSICVDELFYNSDGTIREVKMTKEGVSAIALRGLRVLDTHGGIYYVA